MNVPACGPRVRAESVWCCLFLSGCWGVDVPGYVGGGQAMLCEKCEERTRQDASGEDANGVG